jgi:hypothetical protein
MACKHAPARHVLAPSHLSSLSLQGAPSFAGGSLHPPVAGLQVPAAWHSSYGVHTTGDVVWMHEPEMQIDLPLHQFPSSLQISPEFATGFEQLPVEGSQTPWPSPRRSRPPTAR